MSSKQIQDSSGSKISKHFDQTPWDNLTDMLFGDFDTSGLSKAEIMQICTDCLEVANCPYCYMRIAEIFIDLFEFSIAKDTYQKAELLLNEANDFIYLAQSIFDNFDLSWGMALLETSICLTNQKTNVWHYTLIGDTFAGSMGDNLRAIEYYKLAEAHAVRPSHFEFIADGVLEYLEDRNWHSALVAKSKQIPDIKNNKN